MKNKNQLNRKLEEAGVSLAFLFGSHVSGKAGPEPDIDIGVLTSGRKDIEGHADLYRLFSDFFSSEKKEIDILFLNDAPPAIKLEASDGKILYERSKDLAADFREKAMKEMMDFKFHRDKFEKALLEAID